MKVMKFGGTSVADARTIATVADIIIKASRTDKVLVVLSAMRGNTDLLIQAAKFAEAGDDKYKGLVQDLYRRNETAINDLFKNAEKRSMMLDYVSTSCAELASFLHGLELIRECSTRSLDLVVSFGERMNCLLMARYLLSMDIEAEVVDTRGLILTDDTFGNARVAFSETYTALRERIVAIKGIPVITGFIGATAEGITTTLGRNGSDYSASIVGAALDCSVIEIWTDVDGVLSADPRLVPKAFVIPEISFQEAMELSYFGAKVIHPYTMIPAVDRNIPVLIKNTFKPEAPGTIIRKVIQPHDRAITGIASIGGVAIVNVVGGGMIGVPGIASKVFTAMAKSGINIIMISQASSEHSICLVLKEAEAAKARTVLRVELAQEIAGKMIQDVDVIANLEIIAVIGENMRGRRGLAGKVFSALGDGDVNVLAIAQGSSELNISFVIQANDTRKAINLIHASFIT
jgi:aspartokinase/homoserine dehydrogenase 1